MKWILLSVAFVAGAAQADTETTAVIRDYFKTITRTDPVHSQVCRDVEVRKERDGSPDGGAVILGGIVGNALGAATGIGDGRTLGTVIGGIAGAEISRRGSGGTDVRIERQCQDSVVYNYIDEDVYSHSTATFYVNGRKYVVKFAR